MKLQRLIATALLASCVGSLAAQKHRYIAYVDPTRGNDPGEVQVIQASGVGVPQQPEAFKTVKRAIEEIRKKAPNVTNPGVVHIQPGVVSLGNSTEPLPIVMSSYIDVIGHSAQSVSIDGTGAAPYGRGSAGIFQPESPVARRNQQVLVDFSDIVTNDYSETLQGVTLRNGQTQVYMESERYGHVCVSNCVFDMLGKTNGPAFGALIVSVYDYQVPGYEPPVMKFINNTVIMGWAGDPNVAAKDTCRDGAVGFCQVNDPVLNHPTRSPDPFPNLRGMGKPMLVNNVFRTLPSQNSNASRAMLGIANEDTTIKQGGGHRPGESNAFDRDLVGSSTGPNGSLPRYYSDVFEIPLPGPPYPPEPLPRPWIDVNPSNQTGPSGVPSQDPGFVGEYVSRTYWSPNGVEKDLRDWRLLPDSRYIDQGVNPLIDGRLITVNETIYGNPGNVSEVFDWDGEGRGNVRIASKPRAPSTTGVVDLGYDEASNLISTRSRANHSVCHNQAAGRGTGYPSGIGSGTDKRLYIVPSVGSVHFFGDLWQVPQANNPWKTGSDYWWFPTQRKTPYPVLGLTALGYTDLYLDDTRMFDINTLGSTAINGYVPPGGNTVFNFAAVSVIDSGPPAPIPFDQYYSSIQAVFTPSGGSGVLTNTQCEIY